MTAPRSAHPKRKAKFTSHYKLNSTENDSYNSANYILKIKFHMFNIFITFLEFIYTNT